MISFLWKVIDSVSQRAESLSLLVGYNLVIMFVITIIASQLLKDWRARPFSSRLEIVMLITLIMWLLTCWVVMPYNAYGRWDLLEYPFSPVLSGPAYQVIQDLLTSYYIVDTTLIVTKLRRAAISTYVHHFLMIFYWTFSKVYPEHCAHFLENVIFLSYESTNIPLNFMFLLRELNLRETKMHSLTLITFAASYFILRILIVTAAWLHAFRIWYLNLERGPSTTPSFLLLSFLGMYYILIAYWGVLLAKKMTRVFKGKSQPAGGRTPNTIGQKSMKHE